MKSSSRSCASFLSALIVLTLGGCITQDPVEPQKSLDGAYAVLENQLFVYQETYSHFGDADRPGDFDFGPSLAAYQAEFDADNSDPVARFGLAVTKLMSLSADASVNAAFDEWKAYLDEHTPFEANAAGRTMGLTLGLPANSSALDQPFDLVICSALAPVRAQLAGDEPLVSEVQTILDTVVLPVVDSCIGLLTPVSVLDDFSFPISPMMQGDVYEDPLELDRVEVMALLASCKLLKAGIGVAVAYDVQFDSYNAAGMYAGLNQPAGNVGRLLAGGAARMQAVPGLFLEAVDLVDDALDVLQAETLTDPYQDDDVIRIGPGDVDQDDIDSMQAEDLPDVRLAFAAAGALRTEDWDGDSYTPPTPLRINLLDFFASPISDFKDLLPVYDLVIATTTINHYDSGTTDGVSVHVPQAACCTSYSVEVRDWLIDITWGDPYPDFRDWCDAWIAGKLAELQVDLTWSGSASFYFSDWTYREPGLQDISIYHEYGRYTYISVPEVHWQAQTFAAWTAAIPDPTVSGLLPEMTGGADLCGVFGYGKEDWGPVMTFNWYEGELGHDDPVGVPE